MKTLVMKFIDDEGSKKSLTIRDVKDAITALEAQTLMDTIIAKNIFLIGTGTLVSKDSAYIVDTAETVLF